MKNMNGNKIKQCNDPRHFPIPLLISIPNGQIYKYKCPTIISLNYMDQALTVD